MYGLFSVDTDKGFIHTTSIGFIDDYWAFYLSHIDEDGKVWIALYDQCFYIFNPKDGSWLHKMCYGAFRNAITDIMPFKRQPIDAFLIKPVVVSTFAFNFYTP